MSAAPFLDAPTRVVRHSFPADNALVGPLRKRFIDAISNGSLTEIDLPHWELVFSEMVFNAVLHGAASDPNQRIIVEWCTTQDAIILAVQDPGQGPSDAALAKPSLPDDPSAESGRGLFIIHQFADKLNTWRGPDGFRMEIVKHYPSQGLPLPSTPELDSVLEELSSCYESLSVFHRLTENLIESSNLRDFIGTSLDEFLALHTHDRVFIQGSLSIPNTIREILAPAPWFLDPNDADHTLKSLGQLTRETVWESFEDLARQNLHFASLRAVGAGCVFPIVAGDIHFGALIVLRKSTATDMRLRSLGTLRTLADLCGIACANTHLATIRDESQRDLRELEIAVEIQKSLLPVLPEPQSTLWKISIHQESSLTIAGDYAMAKIDPAGNLVIAMIDVMGKGVSAALLASIFRTAFEMSLHISSASKILETINHTLCEQLGNLTMFITCTIARLSPDARHLDHASAGHCPTLFYRADGSRSSLNPSGPPLGILAETEYSSDHLTLSGGERLVFITDGCYEWDRHEDDLGWERFVSLMDERRQTPSIALWNELRERIRNQHGPLLEDDCTLVTLDIFP
jgi:sigma-B regulation protein RsbU (phosphoserine phosphatase)